MTRFIKVVTLGVALLAVASLASAQTQRTPSEVAPRSRQSRLGAAAKTAKVTTGGRDGQDLPGSTVRANALTVTTAKGD